MKNVKNLIIPVLLLLISASCSSSFNSDKEKERVERSRKMKEDSLALKIGTVPTLDCLPVFVAKELCLFDTVKADIRLRNFASNIVCDDNLYRGQIEGCVTDLVRGQYMKNKGMPIYYLTATSAYWQLISNKVSRIKRLKQLNDKIIAMTRFSAAALLTDYVADSARLRPESVFKVQINDENLRLKMLRNNEVDAVMATEPQATEALMFKNVKLFDSRDKDLRFGVIAFRNDLTDNDYRRKQLKVFAAGYNSACDSINKNGLEKYSDIIYKYCKTDKKVIGNLPKIKFNKIAAPRKKDIDAADRWLKTAR